ncbi:hypothetical protein F4680DRAFT_454207 [Xylaria scruposa]|nr:hypothetical protein F4680DRAFT_454207 [Xylaria scruposa]
MATPIASPTMPNAPLTAAVGSAAPFVGALVVDDPAAPLPATEEEATPELEPVCVATAADEVAVPVSTVVGGEVIVATFDDDDDDADANADEEDSDAEDGVATVSEEPSQPGTVVFGGARPPPQSRSSQISPVSGTYQIRLAPPYATVCEDTQPPMSVLAAACPARRAAVAKAAEVRMYMVM